MFFVFFALAILGLQLVGFGMRLWAAGSPSVMAGSLVHTARCEHISVTLGRIRPKDCACGISSLGVAVGGVVSCFCSKVRCAVWLACP